MFPKWRERWRVHSKQTIYTSKPFNNNPREKRINNTWREREFEKTKQNPKHFKHERATIPPHVQNTLSLQYTSGKTTKTNKKKGQSKPCMHFVTPRGTQCDTLCIIASIFLLIFATESREKKKVNFVFKWQSSRVHFNTSVWCKRLVPLVANRCFRIRIVLKWGITKAYTEAL